MQFWNQLNKLREVIIKSPEPEFNKFKPRLKFKPGLKFFKFGLRIYLKFQKKWTKVNFQGNGTIKFITIINMH